VEGDWSSAAFFVVAGAILGGGVKIDGLTPASHQPDRRLLDLLSDLGSRVAWSGERVEITPAPELRGFDVDLCEAPDLLPAVAILALFARGRSRIRGVAHARLKESDRLEVTAGCLERLGCPAVVTPDGLEIGPARRLAGARLACAGDHRIVMAFAVAGLRLPGVEVEDPQSVAKSNPGFWSELERIEARR
jgi:3-phosphoshikimate 1-carboxyvinyltransferase